MSPQLKVAERFYQPTARHPLTQTTIPLEVRGSRRCVACCPPANPADFDGKLPARQQIYDGVRALVTVNHGRWVIACPFAHPEGAVAQVASWSDAYFICHVCLNLEVGGALIPALWPFEREEIDAVLARRPHDSERNWAPPETVGDLQAENRIHLGVI